MAGELHSIGRYIGNGEARDWMSGVAERTYPIAKFELPNRRIEEIPTHAVFDLSIGDHAAIIYAGSRFVAQPADAAQVKWYEDAVEKYCKANCSN